ncbi:CPCC family cysteine-rich protein [Streptomyces sp. NPDC059491]|uniref:CPCC family cysteine-rich protein n=1 Tax=Streptomyces sp. NPDC059491 TaxID=3346850 RepID=UPI0036942F20
MDTRRPCPCCGHLVFDIEDGWPGSHAVCSVCFWEDDRVQFRWPSVPGGANRVSLVVAQRNYQVFGACDEHARRYVRPPADDEPRDPAWWPIGRATDLFAQHQDDDRPWPQDPSVLCWWLPTFWGAPDEPDLDPDREVVIDVGAVHDERALHGVLKRDLGFPDMYGVNWSAFWDAITGLVAMPRTLRFVRWAELEHRVPYAADVLRERLTAYGETAPEFRVAYDR